MTRDFRDMTPDDPPMLVDLWQGTWQKAMPQVDFAARRAWFIEHVTALQAKGHRVRVLLRADTPHGFVTVDPATGYVDQLAIAADAWGDGSAPALLAEADRFTSAGLSLHVNKDNPRAVRFYEREGFVKTGETVSERSGLPLWAMARAPAG